MMGDRGPTEAKPYRITGGFHQEWLPLRFRRLLCRIFHSHHPTGWIRFDHPNGPAALCYRCHWVFNLGTQDKALISNAKSRSLR